MRRWLLVATSALLAAALLAGGCRPGQTTEGSNARPASSGPVSGCIRKTVVIGVDRSGSFTALLPAAVSQLAALLRTRACPGDLWMFRWIATDSYSDREIILTLPIPPAVTQCPNPFDRRCRAQAASDMETIRQIVEGAARRLEGAARPPVARITDYWGFFVKSSQLFSTTSTTDARKFLIVVGDLADDAGRKGPLALQDVTVITVMFQSGRDAAAHLKLRGFWQDALTAAGAGPVVFGDPSQPPDSLWEAAVSGTKR